MLKQLKHWFLMRFFLRDDKNHRWTTEKFSGGPICLTCGFPKEIIDQGYFIVKKEIKCL